MRKTLAGLPRPRPGRLLPLRHHGLGGPLPTPAPGAGAPATAASPAATVSGVGVVAEVNGAPILASELERRLAGRLARLRQEEYEIRQQALDELIAERLSRAEAARRKLSPRSSLRAGGGRARPPRPRRPRSRRSTSRTRSASPARAAGGRARAHPGGARPARARRSGGRRSRRSCATRRAWRSGSRLRAPRSRSRPARRRRARPTAPVTIVEFTDYQCPYCHRAQASIDEVLDALLGQGALRPPRLPARRATRARFPAARAARCAGEQGKFWEYHRSLMTGARHARRRRPARAGPPRWARRLGASAACLLVGPPRRGRSRRRSRQGEAARRDRHARPTSSTAG